MALSLPCPLPVAPSDPYSMTVMRGNAPELPRVAQSQRELARGAHRADRMRTGRADADLEQVEDTQCHAALSQLRRRCVRILAPRPSEVPGGRNDGDEQQAAGDPQLVVVQVIDDLRKKPAGAEAGE